MWWYLQSLLFEHTLSHTIYPSHTRLPKCLLCCGLPFFLLKTKWRPTDTNIHWNSHYYSPCYRYIISFICYTLYVCEGVWFLIEHTTNKIHSMTDGDDEQTIKLLKHVKGAWVSHLLGGIFMSMRECVSPFFTTRLICRTVKINHLMHFMLNREYFICAQ